MPPVAAAPPHIAVLIPCYNAAETIAKVVIDFRLALPEATIYVYDNGSIDGTIQEARIAGAVVRSERLRGKGHVVRRMFADVEADLYLMVEGDDTYDAFAAPSLLQIMIDRRCDMVGGARIGQVQAADRGWRRLSNRLLTGMVRRVFGDGISDIQSGYRVFSRRFVKSFPALSTGSETATEFTIHALALHMPVAEIAVQYRGGSIGTTSRLRELRNGLRLLRGVLALIEQERPLQSFALTALILLVAGLGLGAPVVLHFLHTGTVPRLPTAILSSSLVLLAFLSVTCGLVLTAVSRGRMELKRLAYLSIRH